MLGGKGRLGVMALLLWLHYPIPKRCRTVHHPSGKRERVQQNSSARTPASQPASTLSWVPSAWPHSLPFSSSWASLLAVSCSLPSSCVLLLKQMGSWLAVQAGMEVLSLEDAAAALRLCTPATLGNIPVVGESTQVCGVWLLVTPLKSPHFENHCRRALDSRS